ncbi:hypothetical protein EVAR_88380_1 [Eumeta japonica]|uniref:Reverse transcriptase domain-containing protein n=1 Tax=Eumeta variegata TaxID=151549 RepID=A0A4C1XCI8_EUMVA|nr:hypothetical protein EVAR_88380_1 [Eumeta japonica]
MVFRNLEWKRNGLNFNGENLNHLSFANDIVVFSENPDNLEDMFQQLSDESSKNGIERIVTGVTRRDKVRLQDIKQTTEFKNIHAVCKSLKWRWKGHMLREEKEKRTRQITE